MKQHGTDYFDALNENHWQDQDSRQRNNQDLTDEEDSQDSNREDHYFNEYQDEVPDEI